MYNINSHTSMLDGFYLTTHYQGECGSPSCTSSSPSPVNLRGGAVATIQKCVYRRSGMCPRATHKCVNHVWITLETHSIHVLNYSNLYTSILAQVLHNSDGYYSASMHLRLHSCICYALNPVCIALKMVINICLVI